MEIKKAVILAGGKGTRFYPITKEIPKPLLPVKRKPIINYLVDLFYSQGVDDIAVLVSKDFKEEFNWWKKRYYPETETVSNKKGLSLNIFEENKPLGTFGGIYSLKDWISDNHFFITNGDELKKIDLARMAEIHQKMNKPATIALVKVSDPENYGVAICSRGLVKEFLEKPKNPPSNYVNSGLYLFSPEIFNYYRNSKGPKFIMTELDIFPELAKKDNLAGFKFQGKWMDCGNISRWEKAIDKWKS